MDINFDGYSDLKIEGEEYEYGIASTIYLFDISKMIFVFDEEFEGLTNLSVDPIEQEISTSEEFPGGRETNYCSYKFRNGHLKLTYSDEHYDNVETIMGLIDDSLRVVKQIEVPDENADPPTYITSKLVDDSLRVVSKVTKQTIDYSTDDQKRNGVVMHGEDFTWVLLKEEIYDYSTDEYGKHLVDITLKEAKHGHWVIKQHQRIPRP